MLRFRQLRKSFSNLVAVDGLTLDIEPGEVFGLLGPNGAGKSTTIGMAVGLLHPDSGTVELAGLGSPTRPEVRRHLGVAPQSLALYTDLTGRENLKFFASLYSLPPKAKKQRIEHVLDLVGLTARGNDFVKAYSGGMMRRLNLAVALIHDPPMLLLDEPTAGVDPQSRNSILDLVRELAQSGRTILYTTHYMEEAARICTRVGVMDQGRLLALGTVSALVANHGGHTVVTIQRSDGTEERVETGEPVKVIARVMAETSKDGADQALAVSGVRIDRPDLESVFLSLTGRRLRD